MIGENLKTKKHTPSVNACYHSNWDKEQKKFRKKKYQTGEKIKFQPVKLDFYPWKKTKWVPVKKTSGREKNGKKCAWKHRSPREKTQNHPKKWLSRALLSFTGEKNTGPPLPTKRTSVASDRKWKWSEVKWKWVKNFFVPDFAET